MRILSSAQAQEGTTGCRVPRPQRFVSARPVSPDRGRWAPRAGFRRAVAYSIPSLRMEHTDLMLSRLIFRNDVRPVIVTSE